MSLHIQLRRDSAADWASNNPTMPQGEIGLETDTGLFKFGDGSTAWNSLAYSNQLTHDIMFFIDGGGAVITTGIKQPVQIDFACTIVSATVIADQSGSIVVDIWKDTYANYPPTDADSITASAPPTLSSAAKSTDSTLTGWTKAISAGDILMPNVDSITTCTWAVVILKVTRP